MTLRLRILASCHSVRCVMVVDDGDDGDGDDDGDGNGGG